MTPLGWSLRQKHTAFSLLQHEMGLEIWHPRISDQPRIWSGSSIPAPELTKVAWAFVLGLLFALWGLLVEGKGQHHQPHRPNGLWIQSKRKGDRT